MPLPDEIRALVEAGETPEACALRKVATLNSLEEIEGWRASAGIFGDLVFSSPAVEAALDAREAELRFAADRADVARRIAIAAGQTRRERRKHPKAGARS